MLYETHTTTEHRPHRVEHALGRARAVAHRLRWRDWRVAKAPRPEILTSAELSECTCPDICHRDHERD